MAHPVRLLRRLMPVVGRLIKVQPRPLSLADQQRASGYVIFGDPLGEMRVGPKRGGLIVQEVFSRLPRDYDSRIETGELQRRFPAPGQLSKMFRIQVQLLFSHGIHHRASISALRAASGCRAVVP